MSKYTIGQEVAIHQYTRDPDFQYIFGKVIKITPTGQITVRTTNGELFRFYANDRQIGGGGRLAFLYDDVEKYKDLKLEVASRLNKENLSC